MTAHIARLPGHLPALVGSWLHDTCHLCEQTLVYPPDDYLFSRLVCGFCHEMVVHDIPLLMTESGMPLSVAGFYDVPTNRVMACFKDHEDLSALMVLYHLLYYLPIPKGIASANAVIVPVPTTDDRLRNRGFNPVLTLAKCLSYLWQIPLWQGIKRHDNAVRQRGLNRQDRLKNVQDDFYLIESPPVRHVILFDDVVTTGSTLTAIANVLQRENPTVKVQAVAVLHGKPDFHLPIYQKLL